MPRFSYLFVCQTALLLFISNQPAAAAEGYAAIEIGGSNVKYVRVQVQQKRGDVQLTEAGDSKVENPGLAAELGASGKFDPVAIQQTAVAVGSMFEELTGKHSLPAGHIAIVGSSSLADAANREDLVKAIYQATGKQMDFITAATEVRYTLLGVVPHRKLFQATLVDVGSGNTKWGHLDGSDREPPYSLVAAHLPWGSKSLAGAISEKAGEFAEPAAFLKEAKAQRHRIASALRQQKAAQPQDTVYLSGGAVWAMVTLVKPQAALEEYVQLTADDFDLFSKRLTPAAGKLFQVELDAIEDDDIRVRAADDLATVRKVFLPEQIVAGGHILLALAEQFDWQDADKEIYFARSGYKAWLKGYLKEFVLRQSQTLSAKPAN